MKERTPDIREAELRAWADSSSTAELVEYLRDVLTPRLVAMIAGVTNTAATRRWADGSTIEPKALQDRLRDASVIAKLVVDEFDCATLQSWAQGRDPNLDDSSPLWVLREGDHAQRLRVLKAAKVFVAA